MYRMFLWSAQVILISVIAIFLCHHLFYALVVLLTTPHTHDLVNLPIKRYENIYQSIIQTQHPPTQFIAPACDGQMKHSLKMFMDQQLNGFTANSGVYV